MPNSLEGFLPLISWALTFCLIFASGLCSSSETALFSLPSTKVRGYRTSKDPRKRSIAKLLSKPQDLLVHIFILNTIVNVLLQNTISGSLGEESSWWLKIALPFFILLLFGEILPKQIGLERNVSLATSYAPYMETTYHFLKPVGKIFVKLTTLVYKPIFFFLEKGAELSNEELEHAIDTSEKTGILHPDEAFLAKGYIDLSQARIQDIMRPKEEILAYNIQTPLSRLFYLMVDQECTRIPIYSHHLENIHGILDAPTLFFHRHTIQTPEQLLPLVKKPFFVPETAHAKHLLAQMNQTNEVFALVVDEYGTLSGLVTKEDLLEEVIGDISDRRDELVYYQKINAHSYLVMGQMDLEELEEVMQYTLPPKEHVQTLGGYLIDAFSSIPQNGATIQIEDLFCKILTAEPHRIGKVFLQIRNRDQNL